MEMRRLLTGDASWNSLETDWSKQCSEVGDVFESYGAATLSMVRKFAETDSNNEWALGLYDKTSKRYYASACAILATQKGYSGRVLRIREVVVCPLLDYGNLPETAYVDTLIHLLNGAVGLSETSLKARHIKIHLRSPADAVFFRAIGTALDSKSVFAATEAHGAWLSFTKKNAAALKAV
jgi:hypothetical protein